MNLGNKKTLAIQKTWVIQKNLGNTNELGQYKKLR